MIFKTCIRDYLDCFFLFNFKFFKTRTVCTAVDINKVNKVTVHHCTVQCFAGVLVDEFFNSVDTK
jgi:hypothetical protein